MSINKYAAGLVLALTVPNTLAVEWQPQVTAKAGYIGEEDRDLGTKPGGKQNDLALDLNAQALGDVDEHWQVFFRGRGFASTGVIQLEAEAGGERSDGFVELREAWVKYRDLGMTGLDLSAGRQRFRDDLGIWWDRELTSAGMSLNRSLLTGMVAVGQQLNSFRSDESDFSASRRDKFRLLSGLNWQWKYNHYLDTKFAYVNDTGSELQLGQSVGDEDRHTRAENSWWLSLNPTGSFPVSSTMKLDYSLGYSYQGGSVTQYDYASNTVTGKQDKDVDAWMTMLDVRLATNSIYRTYVGGHFFTTSSGSDKNTDKRFFQTGLQSNKSNFTGTRHSSYRFNEAFRPELSNLTVYGLYLSSRIHESTEMSFVLNSFSRPDTAQGVISSGINVPLSNGGSHVGTGADINFDIYPSQFFEGEFWRRTKWRLYMSGFWPGDAWGTTSR